MASIYNFATSFSLNNQPCMTWPIVIDLNPDEYNQGLLYYPFMVNLDRCMEVVKVLIIHPLKCVF